VARRCGWASWMFSEAKREVGVSGAGPERRIYGGQGFTGVGREGAVEVRRNWRWTGRFIARREGDEHEGAFLERIGASRE
jgi:hypothetical protein